MTVIDAKTGELITVAIRIDPELKALIPPLTGDERASLEESIVSEGCRDAIVLWNDTIIDGHNRYAICQQHGLPFTVTRLEFATRDEVIVWMVRNQLARRNVTQYAKDELVIRHMKPALERLGLARMSEATKKEEKGLTHCVKPFAKEKHNTRAELAKVAGTSEGGIAQSEFVALHAPKKLQEAARSGDVARRRAHDIAKLLAKLPEAHRERAFELCGDDIDKAAKLVDLHKSSGRPESNGTYDEILRTGGFHYGDEAEQWIDYAAAPMAQVAKALDTLVKWHRQMADEAAKEERIAAAAAKPKPRFYVQGDCLDVLKTLEPDSVKLLLTDPPYGMDFQSNRRTASAQASKISGDEDIAGALELLAAMLRTIDPAMQRDSHALIFTGWRHEPEFRRVIEAAGWHIAASLVWVKENHTSGDLGGFAPKHERIIHARRGRAAIAPRIPDVLVFKREWQTSHPTEKPVALLRQLIEVTTVSGELVVDPFAGTGGTIDAALSVGRNALGIELSDEWYSEGVDRLKGRAA